MKFFKKLSDEKTLSLILYFTAAISILNGLLAVFYKAEMEQLVYKTILIRADIAFYAIVVYALLKIEIKKLKETE